MTFGARLKAAREQRRASAPPERRTHWSGKAVAKRAGIDQGTLSRFESGERVPPPKVSARLFAALEFTGAEHEAFRLDAIQARLADSDPEAWAFVQDVVTHRRRMAAHDSAIVLDPAERFLIATLRAIDQPSVAADLVSFLTISAGRFGPGDPDWTRTVADFLKELVLVADGDPVVLSSLLSRWRAEATELVRLAVHLERRSQPDPEPRDP